MGPKKGPKVGPKVGPKMGPKMGTKVGSKWGSKKWDPKNFEKYEKLFRASNATQGFFGRQMPPGGIGASNAT